MSARVLIVDNYDSFVFNLFQACGELTGREPMVVRNDAWDVARIDAWRPTHIVLSPGPGTPHDPAWTGVGTEVVRTLGPRVPILGVCLGHQIIVHALGGRIVRAREPMHGKISPVHHDGQGVFRGLAQPLAAMRYHSLVADDSSLPASLQVTSQTADGVIMGVRHRVWPMVGLQFHPESVGTPDGSRILANFLDV